MERLSTEMGIPIYSTETDGKVFTVLDEQSWGTKRQALDRLVESKHPGLRLDLYSQTWHTHVWTNNKYVRLIAVGDLMKEVKAIDNGNTKGREESSTPDWLMRQRSQDKLRTASRKFFEEYNLPGMFLAPFETMDNVAAMCALTGRKVPTGKVKRAELLTELRLAIATLALEKTILGWNVLLAGPVAVAKQAKGVAISWGIVLPKDILDVAEQYMPEGVSVETPQPEDPEDDDEPVEQDDDIDALGEDFEDDDN